MVHCWLRLRWLLPAAELLMQFACLGQTGAGAAAQFAGVPCGDCCTVKQTAMSSQHLPVVLTQL